MRTYHVSGILLSSNYSVITFHSKLVRLSHVAQTPKLIPLTSSKARLLFHQVRWQNLYILLTAVEIYAGSFPFSIKRNQVNKAYSLLISLNVIRIGSPEAPKISLEKHVRGKIPQHMFCITLTLEVTP